MKVVYAATPEQEAEIEKLLYCLRHEVLPLYIDEADLKQHDEMGLLTLQEQNHLYNGTMSEAFRIMAALQVLYLIVTENKSTGQQRSCFEENKKILEYYGLFFPYEYELFTERPSSVLLTPVYFAGDDIVIV